MTRREDDGRESLEARALRLGAPRWKLEPRSIERPLVLVLCVWVVTTFLWITPGISRPDGAGTYVYLPSTYFDRDLLFFNEWNELGLIHDGKIAYKEVTPTNHLGNHWTAGSAVIWYPAFVFGDLLQSLSTRFPRNGLSLPYNVATIATSAVAALLALIISYFVARRWTSSEAAALASVGMWVGSPLMWYALKNSLMSHAITAAVCAVAAVCCASLRDRVDARRLFAAGLAIGLALAVRPQNIPFVLLPLFFVTDWRGAARHGWTYAAGGILGAAPQLIASWFLYGNPLPFVPAGGESTTWIWESFRKFWFAETLFSWYHGMIPWTPFLALSLAGLVVMWRVDRRWAAAGLFVFAAEWLINATVDRSFWGGLSFGQRRFDNCTIFFLVGAAVLLARLPRWVAVASTAATSLWTLVLFAASSTVLNLNVYYTPGEILIACGSAIRSSATLVRPLAFVPPGARVVTASFLLATLAATAIVAVVLSRARRHLVAIAAFYLAAISLLFAWCGINGRSHVAQFAGLIRYNRSLGAGAGWTDARIELLRQEASFLEKSGRRGEAVETRREIDALIAAQREGRR